MGHLYESLNTHMLVCYIDRHLFNSLFSRTTWLSWHQKGKPIFNFNETRDDGVTVASAGSYANNLHLAAGRCYCKKC